MSNVTFSRVTSQPPVLQVGAIYFEQKTAATADLYFGDNAGNRVDILTDAVVTALIQQQIDLLEREKVFATIALRDAYTAKEADKAFVIDASDDVTVAAGAAGYIFTAGSWEKTFEQESMDIDFSNLSVTWNQISGGPTSTPAQIDAAVGSAHSHTNKTTLDKFSENAQNKLLFDGALIGGTLEWATEEY